MQTCVQGTGCGTLELEGNLDREGFILRDALAALIQAAEGDRDEARRRLEAAHEAIRSTSFSFRYDEFLRRADGSMSRSRAKPPKVKSARTK